jgi:4-hydroxythreonine-4-phosphate dehydrogenase
MPIAPIAVTMGEPAGIGGELTLAAWRDRRSDVPFFAIDDPERLRGLADLLDWPVPITEIADPADAPKCFADGLPVLPERLRVAARPGQPDPANAPAVLGAIATAVRLVQSGRAGAVVTNPIHKAVLKAAGFTHPGHTEYLADLAGVPGQSVMMLACPQLRVVPVTIHLSLAEAVRALTTDLIVSTGRTTARSLRDLYRVAEPRLAVAALNPHAGESGVMGREEIDVIAPAVAALRADGIMVTGPAPADTLFHEGARATYDAVLCMYHDQALIPLKTIDFAGGVNVTLGLPFVRTSPDHGTAFDIAGRGIADDTSFRAALALAGDLAAKRAAA